MHADAVTFIKNHVEAEELEAVIAMRHRELHVGRNLGTIRTGVEEAGWLWGQVGGLRRDTRGAAGNMHARHDGR